MHVDPLLQFSSDDSLQFAGIHELRFSADVALAAARTTQLKPGTLGGRLSGLQEDTLGFLERFALGRTPPKHDWINLVGEGIVFERDTGDVRVWRFSDGDGLGVYFFNLKPDLPKSAHFASFVATTRESVVASGATLVECNLITLDHVRAIRQIIKAPQKPSGMTYLGAFTVPFASFSYVLKVQCEEHGVTGLREAVLLDEALQNQTVTINPESSILIDGDWHPDSEKFDDRFPEHPLSRLRHHLRLIESSVRLDAAVLKHPRFPLPAADT